jgi:predicted naringenin-chalcone synthase
MTIHIAGLGLALPEHSIAQHEAAEFALASCVASDKQRQLAPKLYQRSGVESRHSVLLTASTNGQPAEQAYYEPSTAANPYGPSTAQRMSVYREQAGDLATRAAEQALDSSSTPADSITHLVTVSCSGFFAPSFDVQLIDRLGLSPRVPRTHVGFMGCHGALNGLRVAKAFAKADPSARVMLVAVELCSLHYQYEWTNERIVSNSLFADGAAALVVQSGTNTSSPWNVEDDFAEIVPNSEDAMSWAIGDHGFQMTLSAVVPELIRQELRSRMEWWLGNNGFTISDVSGWAIHPGGPRILHACQEALGLPDNALAASHETLRQYGNMSSPTVLFVLDKLRDAQRGPTVMLGFGPGLAIEACLLLPSA